MAEVVTQTHSDEVWAFDEHRIGLKPILRRVWAKRGQPLRVVVWPRYQWRYVHGFVHPQSGRTFWWLTSWINTQAFNLVLREFAAWCGAGEHKRVLLVLDQAAWHRSTEVEVPTGILLHFLPPYSPELQPAERLWPLSDEGVAHQCFASIQDLEDVQARRCCQLQDQPERVRSLTRFYWWPSIN